MKITLLIIFFSIASVFLFFKKDDQIKEKSFIENKKTVEVKLFSPQQFSKKIKLSGFTEASRIVLIKAQVDGKISTKQFEKGFAYKAGEQILLINPEDKVAKVKEMDALLNQRKKEYEVAESLYKKGFRSEVKLSQSRTNFENALALFEKSQVELNHTKVSIPFDSIIEDSYVELGDYLKKGDIIAKIVDLDPLFINTNINEKEINSIKLDQKAQVKIRNENLIGKVNYISKTSDPNTRNFKIQVTVQNKDNKIFSGLSSEIGIFANPQDAFFIPSSLVTLNNTGKIGLKVIENGKVHFRAINILSDTGLGYWIQFVKKVDNTDILIITQGQDFTVDGEYVNIIKNND